MVSVHYVRIEPCAFGEHVHEEIEKMLDKETSAKAVVRGWIKGEPPRYPEPQGRKVAQPRPLKGSEVKDHCYDNGQWVDRKPSDDPPNGNFGIVIVVIEGADEVKVDQAILKLNNTGFEGSFISITKIPEPDPKSYWAILG